MGSLIFIYLYWLGTGDLAWSFCGPGPGGVGYLVAEVETESYGGIRVRSELIVVVFNHLSNTA